MRKSVLALAIAALPCAAHAADEPPTQLPAVVVRDSAPNAGAPASSSTSDTAQLLRNTPGVSVYSAGGVSGLPAIHGLADDRLRIKVDGMDLIASCPNHMNSPLSYVDPTNVGSLKVFAGITPVSVGGDSIGGTIIVNTPAPLFAAPGQGKLVKGEIGAFYRSNGDATGANLAATYATESFSMSYAGATAEADNYKAAGKFRTNTATGRDGHALPLDEVGSTAYKSRNHGLGFALKGGNHLVEARLDYQDIPYELYPNQRMDLLGNTRRSFNLRYLGQLDWGTLEARAYHEKVEHLMDFGADKRYWYGSNSGTGAPCAPIRFAGDPAGTCAAGMPMNTEGKTTGLGLKADITLSRRDLLRLGGELQNYRLDDWWPASGGGMGPNTFWNIKDGKRDRAALFGEWERRVDQQWLTMLGARHEWVDTSAGMVHGYNLATFPTLAAPAGSMNQTRDAANFNNADRARTDNNLDLTALARYSADATRDIEFGFARKMRTPNLYERYTWSTAAMMATMNNFVGDGNGYIGDVNLRPEKARTFSATFDWHAADRNWEFKATPYYTRVSDYIDAVQWNGVTNLPAAAQVANRFNTLKFVNQSARIHGLDLSGHMPLAKTALGELGLKGLLNYTNGKNRDSGDDLYNIMPLNAKLTLTQKLGGWDNAVELVMVEAKDKLSNQRNEIGTSGYSLMNLRGSYSWQQVRVDFGVENLFDRAYFLPLGGAYTGQGRTMSMNPTDGTMSWGTAVPGMARSFYTGVNIKF